MSEEKTSTIIILFGKEIVVPKSIVWGLISAVILGALSLSFAFIKTTAQTNKDLPVEQKKTDEANEKADHLRIDMEVVKTNVANTNAKVEDLKNDMNNGFNRIEQRLREMNGQNQQIIRQTK